MEPETKVTKSYTNKILYIQNFIQTKTNEAYTNKTYVTKSLCIHELIQPTTIQCELQLATTFASVVTRLHKVRLNNTTPYNNDKYSLKCFYSRFMVLSF